MKGSQLDYELPEGVDVDSIQLEEGEEMRLPPLPDQADGDFEPAYVKRMSSPRGTPRTGGTPLGTPRGSIGTDEDVRALSAGLAGLETGGGAGGAGGGAPPPLPPRSVKRPPMPETHSSNSHYSADGDEVWLDEEEARLTHTSV